MSNEREVVQYILVNEDLKMSSGKIAAQVAHGAVLNVLTHIADGVRIRKQKSGGLMAEYHPRYWDFYEWLSSSFKKIVLKAPQDFLETLEKSGYTAIRDNGETEVPQNSLTVVVLPPMRRKYVPEGIKELKLLR